MPIKLDNSKVYIYGTGGNGIKLYSILHDYCNVAGFIDKRADEIGSIEGVKVFSIEELDYEQIKDSIVFITLKDVFSHTEIAYTLIRKGFTYLVFKSRNVLNSCSNEKERRIDCIYESLVEHREYRAGLEIDQTPAIEYKLRDRFFISEENGVVTAWCPIELLHNYKDSYDYPAINMPLFFNIIELYKAFMGMYVSDEKYIDSINSFILYCGEWVYKEGKQMTHSLRDSFIESRMSVFEHMQQASETDNLFFIRNAPLVKFVNGKFYLTASGRNRICYLIARGNRYVPVRITRSEYDSWCDYDMVKEYESCISQGLLLKVFAPIPNPFLADIKSVFVDYQKLFLIRIANEITKKIYLSETIKEQDYHRMDFDSVKKKTEETRIFIMANDNNIAYEYFKMLNFKIVTDIDDSDYAIVNFASFDDAIDICGLDKKYKGNKAYILNKKNDKTYEDTMDQIRQSEEKGAHIDLIFEAASLEGLFVAYAVYYVED